jgi:hypothetical protein
MITLVGGLIRILNNVVFTPIPPFPHPYHACRCCWVVFLLVRRNVIIRGGKGRRYDNYHSPYPYPHHILPTWKQRVIEQTKEENIV